MLHSQIPFLAKDATVDDMSHAPYAGAAQSDTVRSRGMHAGLDVTEAETAAPNSEVSTPSLAVRVAAMISLALLPIGLMAVVQSLQSLNRAQDSHRDTLSAQTFQAALPEGEAIVGAFNLARGLAHAMPHLISTPDACRAAMQRAIEGDPRITFVGFVDTSQTTSCNSTGRVLDFSANPQTDRAFAAGVPDISFNPAASESQTAVMIVSEPVHDADDALLGFVTLSVPSTPLEQVRAAGNLDDAVVLVTFNGMGEVLTSDLPRDTIVDMLPADTTLNSLVGEEQRVFSAESVDGTLRDFALVPILPGKAYALGSWVTPTTGAMGGAFVASSVLFPLLMWAASVVVAILALRRLVLEPIRVLRMRMRSFADGRRVAGSQSMAVAPRELREIGETFERMAYQIARDEAELEDKVHEREMLLREVHHRVKNNLQLMSSIINMQIRQTEGAAAEEALRRVQGRLASLAKFHQDLYETSSLSRLRADQLLEDLARQMISMSADPLRQIDLRLDLDEVVLSPDQASPLAMLATEALTNALKYASAADGETPFVAMSLKTIDGGAQVRFALENALSPGAARDAVTGLGHKLIAAFASQLEASVERDETADRYTLAVVFRRVSASDDLDGTKRP